MACDPYLHCDCSAATTGMDGTAACWKKDIERRREIVRKSTEVRVNTSTHCHRFSLLLPVISVKARKRLIRKASMKTSLE